MPKIAFDFGPGGWYRVPANGDSEGFVAEEGIALSLIGVPGFEPPPVWYKVLA